jgi:hypothetical protein
MIPPATIAARILDLPEESLWQDDPHAIADCERRLFDEDFTGIAIRAPRRIDTTVHASLPLWIALQSSGERDFQVPFRRNAVLVAVRLEDGTVAVSPPLRTAKELSSRGGELQGDDTNPGGTFALRAAQVTFVDARPALAEHWMRGTWSITLLCHDWLSNRIEVELAGPVVRGARVRRLPEPPAGRGAAWPRYDDAVLAPPVPEAGVAFGVSASSTAGTATLRVVGSFRVLVRSWQLPEVSDDEAAAIDANATATPSGAPSAVIPATLFVTSLSQAVALRRDWMLPVFGPSLVPGRPAVGTFAIDALADRPDLALAPGRYVAYVVVDGRVSGPQSFDVPADVPA